jgi:hypothetical protein
MPDDTGVLSIAIGTATIRNAGVTTSDTVYDIYD